MSSNPPSAPIRSGSIANANVPPSASVGVGANTAPPPTPGAPATQQNLNQIVLEYLNKKGYSKTEATLRREAAAQDGEGSEARQGTPVESSKKPIQAYATLESYVDDSLEAYRPELLRILWPLFVHTYLDLAKRDLASDVERFYNKFHQRFTREHDNELRRLRVITEGMHVDQNDFAKLFRNNKYRLTITTMAYHVLLQYLESKEADGGSIIIHMIQQHLLLFTVERSAIGSERSMAAMLARRGEEFDMPAEDEGIPGHKPGSPNTDPSAPNVLAKLSLGPVQHDADFMEDVRGELENEDTKNPPQAGERSLVDEYDMMVKKEPVEDGPHSERRDPPPLPPPAFRDVAIEVQKVKEHRDRFKIDPSPSGITSGVSVCTYTFHNTSDSINCIDFSGDLMMVAAGTKHSYIRVWSVDGTPLLNNNPSTKEEKPPNSRRLVGHSGPVYAVSFSPAASKPPSDSDLPSTSPRFLLSCSADATIRLWSIDGWAPLVIYRVHTGPVWDISWGPFGHYFVSGSLDKTAWLWSTEHISPLRLFTGHDGAIELTRFHPNGTYVLTAGDKSLRMWEIDRGNCVRMFTGHTGNITALEPSPDGRILASADDHGVIHLWDLLSGARIKCMRGHARAPVWSLSWSVESSVLVSGGADNTVRVWDVGLRPDKLVGTGAAHGSGMNPPGSAVGVGPGGVAMGAGASGLDGAGAKGAGDAGASSASAATTAGTSVGGGGAGAGKKTKKDVVVTPDQISVFPTKKSPVYKVYFTRSNLVLAAAAYMPGPA